MKKPQPQTQSPDLTLREEEPGTSSVTPAPGAAPGTDATIIETPDAASPAAVPLAAGLDIGGWRLREAIKVTSGEADLWVVMGKDSQTAVVKVFRWGLRPKAELAEKLSGVSRAQVVEVYGRGVLPDGRHYEILEHIRRGTLADLGKGGLPPARVKEVLKELADAVEALHEAGILHRDLKPANVLVRTVEPLDLVLTDFGISSLAELSLHATSAHRTAAYSAPEAMTGVVSRASDWWSVGVMVLELLRGAHPFAGLDERAVNFQLVTRGIEVPSDLASDWALLVKGLLTRDHAKRWGAEQVRGWLAGKRNLTLHYTAAAAAVIGQNPYRFQGQEYGDAAGLAVVLAEHWEEGVKHWGRGYVLQWIEKDLSDQDLASRLHDVQEDRGLPTAELQLAVAVLAMNPELPLSWKGRMVTTESLGVDWEAGQRILDSHLPKWLKSLRGEGWLEDATNRLKEGMAFLKRLGITFDVDSAGRLLASGNRSALNDLVAERCRKYAVGRNENLTAILRKETLEFQEAVALAVAEEKELYTPEQLLIEESLAWLDKQGATFDRQEAIRLVLARDWAVLTPLWKARRGRAWLAKSLPLEEALAETQPEYLEGILGATATDKAFWKNAFQMVEELLSGEVAPAHASAALKRLCLAAEQGSADAQTALGIFYLDAPGASRNVAEAIKWLHRAAAMEGHAVAQWRLGLCYEEGTGVPQSDSNADRWYSASAEKGNSEGQFRKGLLLYKWYKDAEYAARYLRNAAAQGHPRAADMLAKIGGAAPPSGDTVKPVPLSEGVDIIFFCPACEAELAGDRSGVGVEIDCPACGEVVVVPNPQST